MQAELALRASNVLLIVFLGITLIALSLVSMWKESHHGQPLKGIIWFVLVIVGFYAVIALIARYVQKHRGQYRQTLGSSYHNVEVALRKSVRRRRHHLSSAY